jgi:AcrR family transcriptional regulator
LFRPPVSASSWWIFDSHLHHKDTEKNHQRKISLTGSYKCFIHTFVLIIRSFETSRINAMDTKQRILDAAEQLFAEHGFDGASLRAITTAAGVNLAAVNYHFRSKDALIQAVLARKLGPINRQRFALLDACEAEAGSKPVPLEKIVRAMIEPMIRTAGETPNGSMTFGTVMGRVYIERNDQIQRLLVAELRGAIQRFIAAIRRALPGLPSEELYWRLFFTIGAVSHTLAAPGMLGLISGGACNPSDIESSLERLISYVVAGLRAPLPVSGDKRDHRRRRPMPAATARHKHRGLFGGSPDSFRR